MNPFILLKDGDESEVTIDDLPTKLTGLTEVCFFYIDLYFIDKIQLKCESFNSIPKMCWKGIGSFKRSDVPALLFIAF